VAFISCHKKFESIKALVKVTASSDIEMGGKKLKNPSSPAITKNKPMIQRIAAL
jgi:hypothetical protein